MSSRSGSASGRRGRHRPRPRRRGDALLHQLEAILSLAAAARSGKGGDGIEGSLQRRRSQRLDLLRTLLDPLPPDLRPADRGAERFWRAVRWGGAGLILAWWLTGR